MKYVTLRHPKLPRKQTITVHEDAVPVHELAGWEVVDKNADPPSVPATPAGPVDDSTAPPNKEKK